MADRHDTVKPQISPAFFPSYSEYPCQNNDQAAAPLCNQQEQLALLEKHMQDLPVQGLAILVASLYLHPQTTPASLGMGWQSLDPQAMHQVVCRFESALVAAREKDLTQVLTLVAPGMIFLMGRPSDGLIRLLTRVDSNRRAEHPLWFAWFIVTARWLIQQMRTPTAHAEPSDIGALPLKHARLIDCSCVALANWMNLLPIGEQNLQTSVTLLSYVTFAPFISRIRSQLSDDRKSLLDACLNSCMSAMAGKEGQRPGMTYKEAAVALGRGDRYLRNIRPQLPAPWFFRRQNVHFVDPLSIVALRSHIDSGSRSMCSPETWKKRSDQEKSERILLVHQSCGSDQTREP